MGKQDIDIARAVKLQPIQAIGEALGLNGSDLELYGSYKAKIRWEAIERASARSDGALVLVTAMTPTPAGEGKSTTTIGLADGLRRLGKRAIVAIREPSLGPVFGVKGGGTGGGHTQLAPMEDINLHFTGDMHAIGAAHNLLAAMLDNHLAQGNTLGLDVRRILWKRVIDMNDRALRRLVVGMGGPAHGVPRESGFDITVASEIMAILCLARDLQDFKARVERVVVAEKGEGTLVTARDLRAAGAMAVLMKDAIKPNHARARPRRAVRQHRPRLQQSHRHPPRAQARRDRRHRGRLRERPRRREVRGHQVPDRRTGALGSGHRRYDAGPGDAR